MAQRQLGSYEIMSSIPSTKKKKKLRNNRKITKNDCKKKYWGFNKDILKNID